ncbi:uncharacterized protein LOC112689460 [Sipha flava]|uniref:Uncharacterized protein LOC112689460 n=1 Tax=Sipha flava TaxID=143950 RepID=A0A8B8G8N0_9HEMI|nr:uncharacterized protein LOC112689460 [Sipha flava]XP_025418966.1 uncharacterized protein LOC112689460 [Sipha flava]
MSELHLHLNILFVIVMVIMQNTVTSTKFISTQGDNGHNGAKNNCNPSFENSNSIEEQKFIKTFDLIRLMNEAYALKQFYCIVEKEPCDEVGQRIKATISEEILRDCRRCTSTEKKNIERIIDYVQNNFPQFWDEIKRVYQVKKNNKCI